VGVVALRLDPETTPVDEVVRPGVASILESEGVGRAIELMRSEGVRRLPVVDATGNLVGLLSADDVMHLLSEEMHGLAGMLDREVRREHTDRRACRAHLRRRERTPTSTMTPMSA